MDFNVQSTLGNGHRLRVQDNVSPGHVTVTAWDRSNAATFTGTTADLRGVALRILACCDELDREAGHEVDDVWPKYTVHGDSILVDLGPGYHDYHNSPRPNPDGTPQALSSDASVPASVAPAAWGVR